MSYRGRGDGCVSASKVILLHVIISVHLPVTVCLRVCVCVRVFILMSVCVSAILSRCCIPVESFFFSFFTQGK